ncbi:MULTISPECIES: NACHT domain-containing protein [unclassified Streptomyces]|uniref:NACHT domain-containing protein n=1 Tax=unclassified Streptomyces TaxID=2593676 RepID=UPI000DC7AAF8|nr:MULTISPECIES: NACHT domain-containing protein [unclassified Streptomyces]AWZ09300.1 ATP-binding protein [Streptomyces sp. ICC4]AWZ17053.1 ATP-binding protein [Streptomyces sp. ICC1]
MEPTAIGIRLASAVIGPIVKKFFVADGPGAGLVDKPVRLSGHVSFRGEKRTLTEADVRALAGTLVQQALRANDRRVPADEHEAVTDALAQTLHALGDLTITDLDAVRLGPEAFARELRRAGGKPERHLSADATYFYEALVGLACLHILEFFTQRKTFTAHALVGQARAVDELTAKTDELIRRTPLPDAADAAFEAEYLPYVAKKHAKLTIYGIDLSSSPTRWPLDVAYLSLEAVPLERAEAQDGPRTADYIVGGVEIQVKSHRPHEPQPADRVLDRTPRVLLRGEAGSGKTTLVQWLAVTAAQRDRADRPDYLRDRVPFVLPLRTLTRHGERLPAPKDFLTATGCVLAGSQPAGWEHRVLAAGRGLVLVDGIDEVPEPERERTRRWLRDLIDTYDGANRWLVTSRPSAVGQDWLAEEGFDELALSAMGPADVATFIERWHTAARGGSCDDAELDAYEKQLRTTVRTKADLGRLATNPLMCGLICALHRDRRGHLPHGRKDLYEAALSMLVSRRDRERDMAVPDLREEPQLDLLQRLAYWLIKNGRTEMDRSQAEDIIGRALPAVPEAAALGDAATVFEHFLQRSGLLREPAPGTVDFVHRTFQDFLGARAAVEEGDFGLLAAHAADDQWEDVIRMAVALARPRERTALFEGLLLLGDRADDQRTRFRVYLLAAACLEHATTLEPAVRRAVEERTGSLIPPRGDIEARALAEVGPLILDLLPGHEGLSEVDAYLTVVAASRIASDAALPFLAGYADHSYLEVRSQLVWAWSRYDTARYAEEVIAKLDPDGLDYTVTSDEQLHQLERLGVRAASLDVRGAVSAHSVDSYLSRHALTRLRLVEHPIEDLGSVAGQSGLTSFTAADCPHLLDLSPLAALPIRDLHITVSPATDLGALKDLSRLRHLRIEGEGPLYWSPETLHPHAPLEELSVMGELVSESGLKGLGRFTGLTAVSFSGPVSAGDWRELAALPALHVLILGKASLTDLPDGAVLAEVVHLHVNGRDGVRVTQRTLDRLPHAFPHLANCRITGNPTAGGGVDVSPLGALPHLTLLQIDLPADLVHGRSALPDRVMVHTEEDRPR